MARGQVCRRQRQRVEATTRTVFDVGFTACVEGEEPAQSEGLTR